MKQFDVNKVNAKLRALMARPDGLQIFLSKLTSPLKTKRDLQSGLRKVLQFDPLGAGDVPVYDLDPKAYGYQIPYQGGAPLRVQPDESKQITIRTYDQVAYKEFPISLLQIARYDYMKRIEQQLKNAIIELEDSSLNAVLEAVISDAAYPLTPVAAAGVNVTPDELQTVYAGVETYVDPAYIVGTSAKLGAMRTWGVDIFSPVRRESILKTGIIGYVWGASLYKSRLFATDRIFVTGDPEFVGRVPERMSLTPMKAEAPRNAKQEIGYVQNIGICAYNGYGVGVVTF